MKSILDPSFKYVPAIQTDIRKTFERIRLEMVQKRVACEGYPASEARFLSEAEQKEHDNEVDYRGIVYAARARALGDK